MPTSVPGKLFSLLAFSTASIIAVSPLHAEDLGLIQVESSTITEQLQKKQHEPSSTAAISATQVDSSHVENIQQLLQSVPGITTEVQSGDSIKIHIRGIDNQSYMGENPGVAIVIDGVPVIERTGRVNIDLDNIESIKVIKGGASYLYGNDALGGAVIITTKHGADDANTQAVIESGSFGYLKAVARTGTKGDNYSSHLQASSRQADGYHADSNYRADYINGKAQYYLSQSSDLTFGLELSEREKDSHGTIRGLSAVETDPRSTSSEYNDYARQYDVSLKKYFLTYNKDYDHSNFLLNTYQFTDHTQFISAPDNTDPELYKYGNDYAQTQQGVKAEWKVRGKTHAGMIGLDVRDNNYNNETTALIDITGFPPASTGDILDDNTTSEAVQALYAEYKYRATSNLSLTANGRYDSVQINYVDNLDSAENGSRNFSIPSWRIGANYSLSQKSNIFSNASTGFRIPNISELYTGRYSQAGSVAGNPNLDPEHTTNIELGYRSEVSIPGGPMHTEISFFQIQRDNYILAESGLYSGGPGTTFDNIGGVVNQGLELSAKAKSSRSLDWNLAYTWMNARYSAYHNYNLLLWNSGSTSYDIIPYDNTGNIVPRVPEHHVNLQLNYQATGKLQITTELDAISSYYADEMNSIVMPGRKVINLTVSYDIRKNKRHDSSAFLRIDNLLNQQYLNTARAFYDSNQDGLFDEEDLSIVVNPGIVFTLGFNVEI